MTSYRLPPVKFVIDKSSLSTYNRIDFYLAHNVFNNVLFDKGQKDPDFEFYCFTDNKYPLPRIGLKSVLTTSRSGINYGMTLDACEFEFYFKGSHVVCVVEKDQDIIPTVISDDEKLFSKITLLFDDTEKAGELFDSFIKNAMAYVEKYMLDCDMDTNKLTIYMNDEGYWEKVVTRQKRNMDSIYLPKTEKDYIINDITQFLAPETKLRYESLGRTHKRVYLFEGLPGTGKTSFIVALASLFDYDIASITFTDKVTDGSLIRLIKDIPKKTFLVLEDIDVLFTERKKNDNNKNNVTFSGILNSLDGITTKDGFICFITTNHKHKLDSALLRPGRIDKLLEFKHATKEQIEQLFVKFMGPEYTVDKYTEFYKKFKTLNINVTISLLQEYMFKYLDEPQKAIENIHDLKTLYDACTNGCPSELYT